VRVQLVRHRYRFVCVSIGLYVNKVSGPLPGLRQRENEELREDRLKMGAITRDASGRPAVDLDVHRRAI
jgi:hypothetical protein